jgi:hypothetical protein
MVARAAQLIDQARTRTGLSDFGPDGWQEGLDELLRSTEIDVHDDDAVARIEGILLGRLVLRLQIEEWYAGHGDEAAAPVEGPLVIMGLPRTATTATHHMLSLDPEIRYLRTWERNEPLPPPDIATEDTDPRRKEIEASVMHIRTVDGPAEDGPVHMLDFRSGHGLPLPTFEIWWEANRHPTSFAYLDRVLRLLQSHRPPHRWLLKYPSYAFQLDDIIEQYPDAKFIWTHRDPAKLVPSTCSVMVDGTRRRIPDWEPEDPAAFGHEVMERFARAARRGAESRARIGEDHFIDVGQPEMDSDAVAVAERIYEFAGLALTAEVRQAIADWAEGNKRGSRGSHSYSAEQYGLTDDEIRTEFADYLDEYGSWCGLAS